MAAKTHSQELRDAARQEAHRLKGVMAAQPRLKSEAEQLRDYQQRLAQGHAGFADIFDHHGPQGLSRYLKSMDALHRKHNGNRGV